MKHLLSPRVIVLGLVLTVLSLFMFSFQQGEQQQQQPQQQRDEISTHRSDSSATTTSTKSGQERGSQTTSKMRKTGRTTMLNRRKNYRSSSSSSASSSHVVSEEHSKYFGVKSWQSLSLSNPVERLLLHRGDDFFFREDNGDSDHENDEEKSAAAGGGASSSSLFNIADDETTFATFWHTARNFFFSSRRSSRGGGDDVPKLDPVFLSSSSSSSSSPPSFGIYLSDPDAQVPVTQHGKYCRTQEASSPMFESKYNMEAVLCWADVAIHSHDKVFLKKKKTANKQQNANKESPSPQHDEHTTFGSLGVVRLRRLSSAVPTYCEQSLHHDIKISPDSKWASILRKVVGPLHLRLLIEGPEVVSATVMFDHSRCEYWLHFFVGSPGTNYGVNFKVVHDDFNGVDETHHRTRRNLGAYWFPRSMRPLTSLMSKDAIGNKEENGKKDLSDAHDDVAADEGRKKMSSMSSSSTSSVSSPFFLPPLNTRYVQRPVGVPAWHGRYLRGNTLSLLPFFHAPVPVVGVDPRAVPLFGLAKFRQSNKKELARHSLTPWWNRAGDFSFVAAADDGGDGKTQDTSATTTTMMVMKRILHDFPVEKWKGAYDLAQCSSKLQSSASMMKKRNHHHHQNSSNSARIFVTGDSQSRSVMWALKNYIQQQQQQQQQQFNANTNTNTSSNNKNAVESFALRDAKGKKITSFEQQLMGGAWVVTYVWDSYLDSLAAATPENNNNNNNRASSSSSSSSALLDSVDVIVTGYGNHPASWGQWTFEKFFQHTRRVAATLCAAAAQGKSVFWYGSPAWPKPKLVDNFRATNQRLTLYNGIAFKHLLEECEAVGVDVVKAVGADFVDSSGNRATRSNKKHHHQHQHEKKVLYVVDFFGLSSPIMKLSKDGSHYDGSVVVSTLAHQIFSCLCS